MKNHYYAKIKFNSTINQNIIVTATFVLDVDNMGAREITDFVLDKLIETAVENGYKNVTRENVDLTIMFLKSES
jgi:hypothetical protein